MNRSAFGPNYSRSIAMFTDGMSNSILAAEGLIAHGQFRSCMSTSASPSISAGGFSFSPTNVPAPGPQSASVLASAIASCSSKSPKNGGPIGHTRWCNGGVYYSGFTTAMPPNQQVSAVSKATGTVNAGKNAPMDWDTVDENDGGPTYMSLSASSAHPGGVNTLFGDGSVKFIKNSVNPYIWRGLGSIAGGEVLDASGY